MSLFSLHTIIKTTTMLLLLCSLSLTAQNMNQDQPVYNENLIPYQNKAGKWGYLDAVSGQVAIAATYDNVQFFEGNTALVQNINPNTYDQYDYYLCGLIDTAGKEIFPVAFYRIDAVKTRSGETLENMFVLHSESGWGIAHANGQWLIAPGEYPEDNNGYPNYECDNAGHFLINNRVYLVQNKKYKAPEGYRITSVDKENRLFHISKYQLHAGISDWNGNIIIPAEYLRIEFYAGDNRFIASKDPILSALSDEDLKLLERADVLGMEELTETETKKIEALMERVQYSRHDENLLENYLLDETGKEIARIQSPYFPTVNNTVISCESTENEHHFYYSIKDGSPVAAHLTRLGAWNVFREATGFGLANPQGTIILEPRYSKIAFYDENCIVVSGSYGEDNDRTLLQGVINTRSETVIPLIYRSIDPINNGNYVVLGGTWEEGYGVIDAQGNTLIPLIYKNYLTFENGLAEVWNGLHKGVIDTLGREILPLEFSTVSNTQSLDKTDELFFMVEKNEKWGLYNRQGKAVIPAKYGYIGINKEDFEKGWVKTEDENRKFYGLINWKTGIEIAPEYHGLQPFEQAIKITHYQNNRYTYQLLGFDGNLITGTLYNQLEALPNGYFVAVKENKYGIIDQKGKVKLPFEYDHLLYQHTASFLRAEKDNKTFFVNLEGREYIME